MSRQKRYDSNAAKQAAYRLRKKANEKFSVASSKAEEHSCVRVQGSDVGSMPTTHALPFETKKVGEFRMLVIPEQKVEQMCDCSQYRRLCPGKGCTWSGEPVKPRIFKNDFGVVITEAQWDKLQEIKRRAKEGGWEPDGYSQ